MGRLSIKTDLQLPGSQNRQQLQARPIPPFYGRGLESRVFSPILAGKLAETRHGCHMLARESGGRLRSPTWSGPEGSSHNDLRRVARLLFC